MFTLVSVIAIVISLEGCFVRSVGIAKGYVLKCVQNKFPSKYAIIKQLFGENTSKT